MTEPAVIVTGIISRSPSRVVLLVPGKLAPDPEAVSVQTACVVPSTEQTQV